MKGVEGRSGEDRVISGILAKRDGGWQSQMLIWSWGLDLLLIACSFGELVQSYCHNHCEIKSLGLVDSVVKGKLGGLLARASL